MIGLAITKLGERAEMIELPRPSAGHGEIVVRTHYSGVSIETEMWRAAGKQAGHGPPPFVNGCQVSGEVIEVGDGVTYPAMGDMVAAFVSGAHAQYVTARPELTHVLRDPAVAMPAALFVQASAAANALNLANVGTGDTMLVIGQGMIGQCTAMLARLRGAFLAVSEVSPTRLAISRAHCGELIIDSREHDVREEILSRFPGGMDVVVESTGFGGLMNDAIACCHDGGRVVFEGFSPEEITYTVPHDRQFRAFYPTFVAPRETRKGIIRLIRRGVLDLRPLISHIPRWTESEAAYNRLFTPERDAINGMVIDWTDNAIPSV